MPRVIENNQSNKVPVFPFMRTDHDHSAWGRSKDRESLQLNQPEHQRIYSD